MGLSVFSKPPTEADIVALFAATDEVMSDDDLAAQLSETREEFAERTDRVIQVCAGAYVSQGDGTWRFYLDLEWYD